MTGAWKLRERCTHLAPHRLTRDVRPGRRRAVQWAASSQTAKSGGRHPSAVAVWPGPRSPATMAHAQTAGIRQCRSGGPLRAGLRRHGGVCRRAGVRSRDIPTAFGSTHVLEAGAADKPPLLLLHAMSFSAASWVRNLAGLSEHRHVVAVDTIGDVNLSRSERAVRGVDDYIRWLTEVLGALGVERTAVAGNSYGGWLAAHFARLRPERVSHLVLISPALVFVKFRLAFYRQAMRAPIIRSPAKAESFARWFVTDTALQNSSARLWVDQMGQGLPFFRGLLGFPRPRGPFTDAELGSSLRPCCRSKAKGSRFTTRRPPSLGPRAGCRRSRRHSCRVRLILLVSEQPRAGQRTHPQSSQAGRAAVRVA